MKKVDLSQAIELLNASQVVAMPTETVYGLAARINSEEALKLIFKTKERPLFDPLIVHVSSIEMAKGLTNNWNKICDVLSSTFWPGPLTLIVEKNEKINPLITAGLDHVGLRMPSHPIALELIKKLDIPLAAPSANKFKKTSPTTSLHVFDEFQESVAILEGGSSQVGIESTVAQVFHDKVVIYRPGKITANDIKNALNVNGLKETEVIYGESPVAPGQLEEHYRPRVPLILFDANSSEIFIKEKLASINIDVSETLNYKLDLSPEISSRLIYQKMRELSKESCKAIIFYLPQSISSDEKWFGIINRLTKASLYNFSSI